MIKKTITYKDLAGNPVTEDFYFNLSAAEIAEMEITHKEGLSDYLLRIVKEDKRAEIVTTFKSIIAKSFGRKSEDGKRFIKDPGAWREFTETDAYSVLFMELLTNAAESAAFISGILPADLASKVKAEEKNPVVKIETKDPTQMTREELVAAFKEKSDTIREGS